MKQTLPAPWWYVAACLEQLAARIPVNDAGLTKFPIVGEGEEWTLEISSDTGETATFTVTGDASTAIVTAHTPPSLKDYAISVFDALENFTNRARRFARGGSPNDRAIERYYRIRAQGSRITLRQIAEQTGLSYEALRKHKQRYDAAGKWGSKKGQRNVPNVS